MAAEDQNPQPDAAPAPGALVGPSLADFASRAFLSTGGTALLGAFSGMTDTKFEILCAVVVIYLVRDGWVTVEKIRAGLPVKR